MKTSRALSLTVVLLTGGVATAADLRSGPPVGAANDRSGFRPQFVAGPSAGQRYCPV